MLTLQTTQHYIRLALTPALDALTLRKTLETALAQSFGTSRARTYIDVLWLAEDGGEAVVRVGAGDAEAVKGAVAVYVTPGGGRMAVLNDSPFLPALLAAEEAQITHEAL